MTPDSFRPGPPIKPAALPVVALVLAVLGLCLPPLLLVAIVLAVISLVKLGEPAYSARKGLAIAALVIPLALLPVVGILAAIAIPNFIRFQARSKQAECKTYLKAAFTGEKSWYAEHDTYSPVIGNVGFVPERGNRYLYLFDLEGDVLDPAHPKKGEFVGVGPDTQRYANADAEQYRAALPLGVEVGLKGQCPDCSITVACVGNVDNDATLDVWSVSTEDRVAPDGMKVPAGAPMNHVDDTRE